MIFNTFLITLPSLANIGLLLVIVLFIYTVGGVQIFSYIRLQTELNKYANFRDLFFSAMLLMRASTGEGWNLLMDDMGRDGVDDPRFICFQIYNYD